MRIKEVELVGFKSFVDKTRIALNEGICAVVGPNGCGKSNVVDAVRWVMGEMSAKSLRGSDMQDVIFNGTETRKPMGMAQVSIIFDCEDGRCPVGYEGMAEIQVTRRLYRSGESEYLINRRPCRLKDIVDLFLDTGIGSRSYSIIEQGQINKIIGAKPLERRTLIEEAAGISKYRVKREEAERKIEATRINLNRVNDLVYEITRTVNSLQRQAKKAERYNELKAELRELDLELAARQQIFFASEKARVGASLARLQDSHLETHNRIESEETRLAALRLAALEQEKAIIAASEAVGELREVVRKDETGRDLLQRDIEHLQVQIAQWTEEIENARERIAGHDQEIAASSQKIEALDKQIGLADRNLATCREILNDSLARRRELDGSSEAARNELLRLAGRHAALQRAVQDHREQQETHQRRVTANRERRDVLAAEGDKLTAHLQQQREKLAELQELRAVQENELTEKRNRLARMREETENKRKEYEQLKRQYDEKRVRLESLEEMRRNMEGYQEGVQRIIQAAKSADDGLNGTSKAILGVLADKLDVPEKFETALEAILGERLQAVLVTDQDAGATAADFLKEKQAGRGSFVPLQPRMVSMAHYPAETVGQTLGPLATHIQVEPQYQPVTDVLLQDALVVEDLPTAVRLHKANGYTGAFVTLDGEVVDRAGIITGGQVDSVTSGILQKKRQIAKLQKEVNQLEKAFNEAQDGYHSRMGMIGHLDETIRSGQENLDANRLAIAELSGDMRRDNAELERINAEAAQTEETFARLSEQGEQLIARHEREVAELGELDGALAAARTAADDTNAAQSAVTVEIDAQQKAMHEAALTVNNLQQELRTTADRREAAFRLREEAAGTVSRRSEQVERAHEQQETNREQINEITDRLTGLMQRLEAAERHSVQVREGADEKTGVVDETEKGIKMLRRDLDGYDHEIKSCELELVQLNMKTEHLAEKLAERYQMTLADLSEPTDEAEMDTESLQNRQREISDRIGRMGEVNPNAINEYEEEQKRLDTYLTQKADLDAAIDELKKAIAKINKTSKERFLETFKLVDDKCGEIIPLLFGGGSAKLELTEPDKPLESGVDIIIRPPGKKLQNVNLLSGGEKALSSLGLIFSIFLIKPSPFCLLDEVDAPLDDENVSRFNKLIEKMAEHSQVIIITHNKSTMECVDTLYGVTMQEKGVSKLVSVRLVEEPPVH